MKVLCRGLVVSVLVVLSIFLLTTASTAQVKGSISGRIADANSGNYLPGANVMLEGTRLGAASDRFGVYRIDNVPPGTYTLKVSYIGYEDFSTMVKVSVSNLQVKQDIALKVSAVQMKEIVVSGLREGQMKALSQQMAAPNIKNVMAREEMERFPDMNTAEVLQRVPGVALQRSLGEGRFIYLRGTEPRLTTVTVNGEKIASPEDEERFVGLDVINASQLAEIDVTKTLTPDLDGDAIGGVINLVTRSAFDHDRAIFKLNLGGGYSVLPEKPLYRGALTYSNRFGANKNFGFTVSSSWYRNSIGSHSNEFDWDNQEDVNGNPLPFALSDYRMYNYNTDRDHYGISGELEYRINENNRFFLRAMYNQRNDNQVRNMVRYRISKGDYLNATTVSKARLAYEMQARDEIQKINSFSGGGIHRFNNVDLDYTVSYSYADETKKNPGQFKSEFQLDEKVNLTLGLADKDFPELNITNLDKGYALDPSHWEIDSQDFRKTFTSNNDLLGSLNLKFPYSLAGYPAKIKAGGKIHIENKDRDSQRWKYKWKGADNVFMSSFSSGEKITNFLLDHYTFAPVMGTDKYSTFFDKYRGKDDGLREEIRRDDADGEGGKYTAGEDVYASYAMTTVNFGNLMLLAGVRDEITRTSYDGIELVYDNNGDFINSQPTSKTNTYNNIFPNVQLRYQLSPRTNLRLAFTSSIARPNYFDLAPYKWVFPEDEIVQQGNPDLKPTTSINYDAMFEHYFHGIGIISGGFFYKSLDQVSYHRIYRQVGGPWDGYFVEQPVNGGSANLYGFEVNWMQQFTFLPGLLSGFGIYGNYTHTISKADLLYRDWNVLPGQAGDVGNIGLSFEKYGLTARLSLNYNDKLLYEIGKTPDFDRYTDAHKQLDLSATYRVMQGVNIYLEMINITNEPRRDFWGVKDRPRMNEYYGLWSRAGLKLDF